MTPERYRELEDLYHRALDKPAAARQAFVEAVCAGDEALRPELESLLSAWSSRLRVIAKSLSSVRIRLFKGR